MKNFIFILLLLTTHLSILHADYPQAESTYFNDWAEVVSPGDAAEIIKMAKDLEHQTGIELVVVTIDSIYDYDTGDNSLESFATNLFNRWGVGDKKKNNGVMLLVAVKDRNVRIELGRGYGHRYDDVMKEVIDKRIIPHFKNDEYSRGIYEGTRATIEKVTKKVSWFQYYKWHLLLGVLIVICIFAGISCMKSGKKGWGWAFFAAAGVLFIFLIKMIFSGKGNGGGSFGGGSSFGGGASGSW